MSAYRRILAAVDGSDAGAAGVAATTLLVEGAERSAAQGILEEAAKRAADLIVLGTHGRRGLPVLLVRAPS
jgi:nucleotide-binding universal stress UspA family protein